MNNVEHRQALVHVLHMAYSGERAASLAYNAHWRSLKREGERAAIKKIEQEELDHKEIVGNMLSELGERPQALRDWWMGVVGKTVGLSCYVIGWFLPMYFAGRLENANVAEYDVAALHASTIGLSGFAKELKHLSSVEHEHEAWFLGTITGHRLVPLMRTIFGWGPSEAARVSQNIPPLKETL